MAALLALYVEIDGSFEAQRRLAAGDQVAVDRIETKQRLNDQAYFVLCWGQLEAEIDDACRAAIRRHKGDSNWTIRRAWDRYNPDDKRLSGLSFVDRVGLVTDRYAGHASVFARIIGFMNFEIRSRTGDSAPTGLT